jgi:DNA adenine methylase
MGSTCNPSIYNAEPFLKWAGGKTQLLPELDQLFPKSFKAYYEPFCGSAAVFFHLRRTRGDFAAHLSDQNADLVKCYRGLQQAEDSATFKRLVSTLKEHARKHAENAARHYYTVRSDQKAIDDIERAARFIYLNKTCYNGLYRVNSKGKFNVPIGAYTNPTLFVESNLRAVVQALKETTIDNVDFADCVGPAKAGDLIYFDPPYYYRAKSAFTAYSNPAFGADEHKRLAVLAKKLADAGCKVIASNNDDDFVRRIYAGFEMKEVYVRRPINSNSSGRGAVKELLIWND